MATTPGPLTSWPWQKLGSFKYVVLAPWVAHSIYSFVTKDPKDRDLTNLLILPYLLWRLVHHQAWITLARHQTAKSKHRILDKGIEFEQVDRERNWDDLILLNGILFYMANLILNESKNLPMWRTDGVVLSFLLHMGPVEFLYYWLHRALHHHFLYSRYHSHHHSSIVTEPITAVVHPFAEHIAYFALFSIPMVVTLFNGTASIASLLLYITYVDFMNNLGHCNFEVVPKWIFDIFPFVKYLMYTPSFHSLHHTQFRTNFSLFMPLYDYMYGTMDISSDKLYETSLKGRPETLNVVHLTHPTTLESLYHLRPVIASLASGPYAPKWYLWMLRPVTYLSMLLTWIFGSTFTIERNVFDDELKMQTWAIPRFSFHYFLSWHKDAINRLIEKAILDAEQRGVKVLSLGLLNQGEELNKNGELYLQKHPNLKVRIVDGSGLAVGVVLNSIPQGTKQVLLRGRTTKTAIAISRVLCQRGIQVAMIDKNQFDRLKLRLPTELWSNLFLSTNYNYKVWLVGEGALKDEEQRQLPEGTHFIPFSQFPPKRVRSDCIYYTTPALRIPKALENVHSCENWLPRRVMSAWRVAGIVHALEGWDEHECGDTVLDVDKVWTASLRHGFLPVARA
ncbi:PREDICTED: protein ECERIFERUM 1-like isoform X1 [Nelumbo nucifera]|uniref:Protein ECERIFERUM 1-like isoform X1 n=1 Tax=Nelumbo nucifera TaxID=4432 RepID=A0A1U8Q2N7_NELNU|nr:PREDICTED: protein ECERIFERUM 1-like isoform X1 [Nelumbo nucifera]